MNKTINALVVLLITIISCLADQSVTLAWDPNPEPDVTSYVVYYGTNSRTYTASTNVGNVTTATVYGLVEGTTHYLAVTAKNARGLESDFSNEVTNAIPANVTNRVPTVSAIPDITIIQRQTTNFTFVVWDVETHVTNLLVSVSSTNVALLNATNCTFSTNGAQRTITISPPRHAIGKTLVTLVVSDGTKASSTSFMLTVIPLPVQVNPFYVKTGVYVAPNYDGPWTEVQSTVFLAPIELNPWFESNKWYRMWR